MTAKERRKACSALRAALFYPTRAACLWRVQSETSRAIYEVRLYLMGRRWAVTCDCPDFLFRRKLDRRRWCKHIHRIGATVKAEAAWRTRCSPKNARKK